MFKIGEFSKIAQVSCRLLRYYDEIGLFIPTHIDTDTGYRYYTAEQMPRLNRILALKNLGLSLDQVARFLNDDISPSEIRGMLNLKKAQIEQDLHDDLQRLRTVEARLTQIETEDEIAKVDVILKTIPAQPFMATRTAVNSMEETSEVYVAIHDALYEGKISHAGQCVCVTYKDRYEWENVDLEIGFVLNTVNDHSTVMLPNQLTMHIGELPAVETMATAVHVGYDAHSSYQALGLWIERNGYQISGPHREVFYKRYWDVKTPADNVVEIQFPVEQLPLPSTLSMIRT